MSRRIAEKLMLYSQRTVIPFTHSNIATASTRVSSHYRSAKALSDISSAFSMVSGIPGFRDSED
ncbi:MAG: hypothetical protein EBS01_12890 [Verrucomicrobia bacterium]|nr:hypothetical protein [Verrucomicrobiota bacterium]